MARSQTLVARLSRCRLFDLENAVKARRLNVVACVHVVAVDGAGCGGGGDVADACR